MAAKSRPKNLDYLLPKCMRPLYHEGMDSRNLVAVSLQSADGTWDDPSRPMTARGAAHYVKGFIGSDIHRLSRVRVHRVTWSVVEEGGAV
jgi:hypothetical protein